jgi:hypothetical protein
MANDWYQQALTPPDVLQINVRVGLIPSQDHVQALAEMVDPTTGVQVAMWAHPHTTMREVDRVLDEMRRRIDGWLSDAVEPF